MKKKIRKFVEKIASKTKSAIKCTVKCAFDLGLALLVVGSLIFLAARAPELHNMWIRHTVGTKVFKIQDTVPGGGGTGFAVKGKSGQSYILTNEHVCAASQDDNILVVDDAGNKVSRRILERSDKTDLCLIEGMPGLEGLELGGEVTLGDTVTVVGHPRLRPLSLSSGEVVGHDDVKILDYALPTGDPLMDMMTGAKEGKCDKPKNELIELPIEMFGQEIGKIKLCLNVTKEAIMTTAVIFPGNSGSPVVDYLGNVVGVAFATDGTNWGYLVNLKDMKDFLARY